jgi:hypothetical protein
MDTHPDLDMLSGGPWMCLNRLLYLRDRSNASPRRGEHHEKRVSVGARFLTRVSSQTRPDEPVMVGE